MRSDQESITRNTPVAEVWICTWEHQGAMIANFDPTAGLGGVCTMLDWGV